MEQEMCHLFASQYGWTDDYILNHVYLDSYFIRKDIINRQKRQDYLQQIQVAMIPHMENKDRQKIVDGLINEENKNISPKIGKGTETDFGAIERVKQQYFNK